MIKDLVKRNRSYRRFYQSKHINTETLYDLINLARLSPSAANLQYLKYIMSNSETKNNDIFETLSWAGYIKNWQCPPEGEKPSAYIIILGDNTINKNLTNQIDAGIAAQSILLGAAENKMGGCIFGSIKREILKVKLNIPDQFEIIITIALGYPKEKVVIEEVKQNNDIKYWRDSRQIHHVPKRKLEDIILI